MKTNRHFLSFIALSAAVAVAIIPFSACGKGAQASISIRLINAPATLTINQTVSLTATVGDDSSNSGVDWSCSGSGGCGTFNPTHTASGGTTVFTAPASPGAVTITAAATASRNVKATAVISIVPIGSNSMLNGRYVFSVGGVDTSGSYTASGTIIADGSGNITGGEQDYADESIQAGPDAVTGSYSIGPDGRGSITLDVSNASLPHNGVETFSIAVTSTTHALIIQFDGTATSSGTLDFQAASAVDPSAISGAFAFTAQGIDIGNQVPLSYGGVLLMSASSGSIVSGTFFENDGGSTFTSSLAGSLTAPDAFGRGTLAFSLGVHFAYYAVQGQVLRLVGKDLPSVMTGGSMYGQGAAGAGATFSNASLSGNHVLCEAGGSLFGPLVLAGQFLADGAGSLTTGVADTNDAGTTNFSSIAGQAVYSIAGDGTGTLTLPTTVDSQESVSSLLIFAVDPAINLYDPNSASGGGGALVMDYDSNAVATGLIVPQASAPFEGNYAVNLQFVGSGGENDWVGQSVASSGALTGTVDINDFGATSAGVSLTGTFSADAVNVGRWTGSFTVNTTNHHISYYQVSETLFVIIDTDSADIGVGIMEKE
ncbi:MAG: hypothetical protein ABSG19_01660 [Candidatus Aminicenantales bacterium]